MKNQEISNKITEKEKNVYETPTCDFIELDLECPVLQASAEAFGDGGRYGRSAEDWDW